jgi:hypothetical protein
MANNPTDVDDGQVKTVEAVDETVDAAFAKAQAQMEKDATVLDSKVLISPAQDVLTIDAFDKRTARIRAEEEVRRRLGDAAIVRKVVLLTIGKKGFLGIGRKANQYRAELFRQALVSITYRSKVKAPPKINQAHYETVQQHQSPTWPEGWGPPSPPDNEPKTRGGYGKTDDGWY